MNSPENGLVSFDEEGLKQALTVLDWKTRTVFAAACAQRLGQCVKSFENAYEETDIGNVFSKALNELWRSAEDSFVNISRLPALYDTCLRSLPDDEIAWNAGVPFADDGHVGGTDYHKGELDNRRELADRRVQQELRRQSRDLRELVEQRECLPKIAVLLRSRSNAESENVFE